MKLNNLIAKLVPNFIVALFVCMLLPFRVALTLGEPVESNVPTTINSDSEAGRIIYDQRQTGKYNIHLSIKDVAIIEMDQNEIEDMNYNEDYYYYDEGHLTVKPIVLSPTSALNKPNQTTSSTKAITTTLITPDHEQPTSPNPTTSKITNNQTFSHNLLADIAATHAADNINVTNTKTITNVKMSSTTPTSIKRKQNVVILDTQSTTHNSPTSTHKPKIMTTLRPAESKGRTKHIPIQSSLQEPLLHPHQHFPASKLPPPAFFRFIDTVDANGDESNIQKTERPLDHEHDSKIYQFKVRRAHKGIPSSTGHAPMKYPNPLSTRRCRANQFRDIRGNCRAKRSSSLLKKLFSMLITLPFANDRAIVDQDDE